MRVLHERGKEQFKGRLPHGPRRSGDAQVRHGRASPVEFSSISRRHSCVKRSVVPLSRQASQTAECEIRTIGRDLHHRVPGSRQPRHLSPADEHHQDSDRPAARGSSSIADWKRRTASGKSLRLSASARSRFRGTPESPGSVDASRWRRASSGAGVSLRLSPLMLFLADAECSRGRAGSGHRAAALR